MNAEERSGFAETGGASIYYEVVGQGHPLVLLNEQKLDLRMWDCQVEEFARRFEVVRYDRAETGKTRQEGEWSSPPRSLEGHREYLANLEAFAEEQGFPTNHGDLRALLDHLGIDRAHLLGLGTGATFVIDFVLEYPERASALVLASTPHVWGNESLVEKLAEESGQTAESFRENLAGLMPLVEGMFETGDVTPLIEAALKDPSYAPSREPARRKLRQLLMENVNAILAPQEGRRYSLDFSAAGRLREIVAPVLVVYGEKDIQLVKEAGQVPIFL